MEIGSEAINLRLFSGASLEYLKRWRAKNPARVKGYNLKRAFGITLEEYDAMLQKQGGVCAVCGNPEKTHQNGFPLAVDHYHETKKVRGLLCLNCNRGIGHFEDNPELLAKAIQYLEKG